MKTSLVTLGFLLPTLVAGQALAQSASGPPPLEQQGAAVDHAQQLRAAREFARLGRYDEAIGLYSEMLERSPRDMDLRVARGRAHAWNKDWAPAEADLLAATDAASNSADAWSALGDMYLWSDRPAQAAEAYGHWVALKPDDAAARSAQRRALENASGSGQARSVETSAPRRATRDADMGLLRRRADNPQADVPDGFGWSASLAAGTSTFNRDRDNWQHANATLRRHFDRGSLAVELLQAQRFGRSDLAWALDGYADLWSGSYANLRYQHGGQDSLFAERAWRAELFQNLPHGWEVSGSYDRLEFAHADVGIYGLGLGKYVGNFYLRGLTRRVQGDAGSHSSHRGLVRWYYAGNADDYFEVSGGTGRSGELTRAPADIETGRGSSLGVALVKYWTPQWGFKVALDYADTDFAFVERRATATLYRRW